MCQKKLNDNDIFQHAQQVYLSQKSSEKEKSEAWEIMFSKVYKCLQVQARRYLHCYNWLAMADIEESISECMCKIMNRYIGLTKSMSHRKRKEKKPYRIKNLASVCNLAVYGELFNKKAVETRRIMKIGVLESELSPYLDDTKNKQGDNNGNI